MAIVVTGSRTLSWNVKCCHLTLLVSNIGQLFNFTVHQSGYVACTAAEFGGGVPKMAECSSHFVAVQLRHVALHFDYYYD